MALSFRTSSLLKCSRFYSLRKFTSSSYLLNTNRTSGDGFSFPSPKLLSQIVKLDVFLPEDSNRIKSIWEEYHNNKDDCVGTTLTVDQYQIMSERSKECPFFITPIHRGNGFFNVIYQFQNKYILVTLLESYKCNPTTAPPLLTITCYPELIKAKKIVLLRGEIINTLDKKEATKIVSTIVDSYLNDEHFSFVNTFNKSPREFSFENYRKFLN